MRTMLLTLGLIGISAPTSIAYLTDMKSAENKTGFTENRIRAEEEFKPPSDLVPGTRILKSPKLINESHIPVYVRMSARFSDDAAEQLCMPLVINSGWRLHTDGYYYFHRQLEPAESTTSLFDQIIIRDDISVDDIIPFDMLIYGESIQAYGMTAEEAWAFFEKNAL